MSCCVLNCRFHGASCRDFERGIRKYSLHSAFIRSRASLHKYISYSLYGVVLLVSVRASVAPIVPIVCDIENLMDCHTLGTAHTDRSADVGDNVSAAGDIYVKDMSHTIISGRYFTLLRYSNYSALYIGDYRRLLVRKYEKSTIRSDILSEIRYMRR